MDTALWQIAWTRQPGRDPDTARLTATAPANLGYFRGHFDGMPILPGVVQLEHLVLAPARELWPSLGTVTRLSRVKFKQPIVPGSQISVELRRRDAQCVVFRLWLANKEAASGTIAFTH